MRDLIAFVVLPLADSRFDWTVRFDQIESFWPKEDSPTYSGVPGVTTVRTLTGDQRDVLMTDQRVTAMLIEAATRVKEYEQQQWVKNHAEM